MNAESESPKTRRKKGQRKDGRYVKTFSIGSKSDGTYERKYFYGDSLQEVNAKIDEYKNLLKTGFVKSLDGLSVKEWVNEYESLYHMPKEYGPYRDRINADIGNMALSDIRPMHLQRSLNNYSGKSKSAATKYRMLLKQVFYRAYRNKLIVDDPSIDLMIPDSTTKGTHRALEQWEIDLILNHWQAHNNGLWFILCLCTGLRRSEMIALNWNNIDLDERIITVSQAAYRKGNQFYIRDSAKTAAGMRSIPIPNQLYDALLSIPPHLRKGLLCTIDGTPLSENSVRNSLNSFCKALEQITNGETVDINRQNSITEKIRAASPELENTPRKSFLFRYHDLRHTYATGLYDAGIDVKAAQYLLGHSDIRITIDLYTHLSQTRKKKSFSIIKNHINDWNKELSAGLFLSGSDEAEKF